MSVWPWGTWQTTTPCLLCTERQTTRSRLSRSTPDGPLNRFALERNTPASSRTETGYRRKRKNLLSFIRGSEAVNVIRDNWLCRFLQCDDCEGRASITSPAQPSSHQQSRVECDCLFPL